MTRALFWRHPTSGLSALASICHIILAFLACPAVYADGMESSSETPGHLRVVGSYPYELKGHLVTALSNGKVLAYGIGPIDFRRWNGSNERVMNLRNRHESPGGTTFNVDTLVWDPQLHGWKEIERPPECKQGKPSLHTATVLPGPKILFAGGLCDEIRMADDASPRPEYKKLSLWNGETEKWEPAPVLEHGRVYHTASLLSDGGVLIAGGESDPALFGPGEPVLASVELYANGNVEQMPALHEARAKHTATVGAHGEVLVAGGYDSAGQALASVEIWNPVSREWIQVTPMSTPRHSHSATLLEDGRILVAGGVGAEGRPLQSVEIWNPASGEWTPGASLPQPLRGHGAVLLDGGNLLLAGGQPEIKVEMDTWAWLRDKSSGEWQPAGRSRPIDEADLAYTPTFAKNRDGSVHIFSRRTIMQWRPGSVAPASVPPQWAYHKPALAVLDDGRVMTIGNILNLQSGSSQYLAHLWDPRDDTWSAAGQLVYKSGMATQALQLPSGKVMHLGFNARHQMLCELWTPGGNSWESCGEVQLKFAGEAIVMSLLDDGRAVVITNAEEAHIFDERTAQWATARQKWNYDVLSWGAPIWQDKPFDTLTDEENREFDVSRMAGKFLADAVSNRGPQPRMLWDPAHKRWAYVLKSEYMGPRAVLLPDGCALSPYGFKTTYRSNSFSMFQAATGLADDLFNPGTGISTSGLSMDVLKDGTVIIAGEPEEANVTFFHRKVSCAGWAAEADDWALMPGVMAKPVAVALPAAKSAPEIAPVTMRDRLLENRWLILAVAGPMVLYVLLRFIVLPLARSGASRVMPKTAAQSLDRPVPKKVTSVMRFFVYGTLLVIAIPTLLPHLAWWQARSAEECATTACRDPKNGLLESVPSLEKNGAQPTVPCKYVGLWASTGQNLHKERILLKDDGTYSTQPGAGYGARTYTGYWMVQGDKMVWKHNEGYDTELDINQIRPQTETRFELIEQNGWHTRFDLIERTSSKVCGS